MANTAQEMLRKICEWMSDPHNWEKKETMILSAQNLSCEEQVQAIINKFTEVDQARHYLKEQGGMKYGESK